MAVDRVATTPVRSEKDMILAIEELRRHVQRLIDKVNTLESRIEALEPPSV